MFFNCRDFLFFFYWGWVETFFRRHICIHFIISKCGIGTRLRFVFFALIILLFSVTNLLDAMTSWPNQRQVLRTITIYISLACDYFIHIRCMGLVRRFLSFEFFQLNCSQFTWNRILFSLRLQRSTSDLQFSYSFSWFWLYLNFLFQWWSIVVESVWCSLQYDNDSMCVS